jgi:hypothetical protein
LSGQDKLFVLHELLDIEIDQIRERLDGKGLIEEELEGDNETGIQIGEYSKRVHAAQVWSIWKALLNAHNHPEHADHLREGHAKLLIKACQHFMHFT